MKDVINIFWFRRDLRLDDNYGLWKALAAGRAVLPLFIFDTYITHRLEKPHDNRINFIHSQLQKMHLQLRDQQSSMLVLEGRPDEIFATLALNYKIDTVFCNEDYEPYGIQRDQKIKALLNSKQIIFTSCCDHLLFRPGSVMKGDGTPYTVFTPFSKKWKQLFNAVTPIAYDSGKVRNAFLPCNFEFPEKISGFRISATNDEAVIDENLIRNYHLTRDYPSLQGSSKLGRHLRFGTISPRALVFRAAKLNATFLNELIWREFFMHILWHYPDSATMEFKQAFRNIEWRYDETEFRRWCSGETGIPLVDAGMRELNETGFMHNRLRMITASFLSKNLLTDWRLGEAYFAARLMDYELSSNAGNWQWAAGTGCDAAPYFRVFNPVEQAKKFDPEGKYIRKWVPEAGTSQYVKPMLDLKASRERAISVFRKAARDR